MSAVEKSGVLTYVDSSGQRYILYPDTKIENIEGLKSHIEDGVIHVTAADRARWDSAGSGGSAGGGGYATGELEDTALETGTFLNAAAGWNSFRFREAFEDIPVVVVQSENFSGRVEIKNVSKEGFLYCLRKAVYTQGAVTTGEYFTASQSSTTSHAKQNLVSAVTLPTYEETTTEEAIKVNYIAIEYGGDR